MIKLHFDRTIDFLKFQYVAIGASVLMVLASIAGLAVKGINYGVDFMGGAEMQFKFREVPEVGGLRERLRTVNLGDSVIQQYGEASENEVLVRTALTEMDVEGVRTDIANVVVEALRSPEERAMLQEGRRDLNLIGWHDLADLWSLAEESDAQRQEMEKIAHAVVDHRVSRLGLIRSYDEISDKVPAAQMETLKQKTFLGSFTMLRVDRVGPRVSSDLREKTIYAIVFSMLAILVYLWYRFELRFSVAALIADAHDVLVTVGVLVWTNTPFDLSVVAALLTIAGYSLNDSIVILDRVRENMKLHRRTDLYELLNMSMTQVIGRSVLTSVSVLVVVVGLFFYGGETVHPFSFAMLVGTIVGSYSTTFIVLPTVQHWKKRRSLPSAQEP
jgi:preprotein translocase subunit SecF